MPGIIAGKCSAGWPAEILRIHGPQWVAIPGCAGESANVSGPADLVVGFVSRTSRDRLHALAINLAREFGAESPDGRACVPKHHRPTWLGAAAPPQGAPAAHSIGVFGTRFTRGSEFLEATRLARRLFPQTDRSRPRAGRRGLTIFLLRGLPRADLILEATGRKEWAKGETGS